MQPNYQNLQVAYQSQLLSKPNPSYAQPDNSTGQPSATNMLRATTQHANGASGVQREFSGVESMSGDEEETARDDERTEDGIEIEDEPIPGTGRSEAAVLATRTPKSNNAHPDPYSACSDRKSASSSSSLSPLPWDMEELLDRTIPSAYPLNSTCADTLSRGDGTICVSREALGEDGSGSMRSPSPPTGRLIRPGSHTSTYGFENLVTSPEMLDTKTDILPASDGLAVAMSSQANHVVVDAVGKPGGMCTGKRTADVAELDDAEDGGIRADAGDAGEALIGAPAVKGCGKRRDVSGPSANSVVSSRTIKPFIDGEPASHEIGVSTHRACHADLARIVLGRNVGYRCVLFHLPPARVIYRPCSKDERSLSSTLLYPKTSDTFLYPCNPGVYSVDSVSLPSLRYTHLFRSFAYLSCILHTYPNFLSRSSRCIF
jgi:hypothetical protein